MKHQHLPETKEKGIGNIAIPHFSTLPTKLKSAINQAHYQGTLVPRKELIFHPFYSVHIPDIKVVIIGGSPYHRAGNGLAFGQVPHYKGRNSPEIDSIQKEVLESTGNTVDPSLTSWARQGVLLLHANLTSTVGSMYSHKNLGWEQVLTDFIKEVSETHRNVVWMLWGAEAAQYKEAIYEEGNLILEAGHPLRGFSGCDCFAEANEYLERRERGCIDW